METTINQRVKEFCDFKNISQSELSRIVGIGRATVSAWFRAINPQLFPAKHIRALKIKYPDLNEMYIWQGVGNMMKDQKDDVSFLVNDEKADHQRKCMNCQRLYGNIEQLEKQVRELKNKNEELLKENGGLRYLLDGVGKTGG